MEPTNRLSPWPAGVTALLVAGSLTAVLLASGPTQGHRPALPHTPRTAHAYQPPLAFEPNGGRTDKRVNFLARGAGYALFLTARETVLKLADESGKTAVVRSRLLGASPGRPAPEARLPGIVNSYVGPKAVTGLRTYGRVRYRSVYPGTDLVYYGKEGRLEYDFVLHPGSDPSKPGFAIAGVRSMRVDSRGDLVLKTNAGTLRQLRPYAYQRQGATRTRVPATFKVEGRRVHFSVGRYDRDRDLVIDPRLVYSTYFGGNASDYGWGVTADSSGSVYITGATLSSDFPTSGTNLPYHSNSFGDRDVFLTRFTPDGQTRVFSTYYGGNAEDVGKAVALDGVGGVYITGYTASGNNYHSDDTQHLGSGSAYDAFYASFDSDGFINWSGEIGGTTLLTSYNSYSSGIFTAGFAIAADSSGNAYITGGTVVSDLRADYLNPATTDVPANNVVPGDTVSDAFVLKLAPTVIATKPTVAYLHYLGGNSLDEGLGIATDGTGRAYVVGRTFSSTFEGASGPGGGYDGFIVKMKVDGTAPETGFSKYIGGAGNQHARAIALDGSGNAYVAGAASGGLTTTGGAFQTTFPGTGGTGQGFVTKFDSTFTPVYATYLGGSGGSYGTQLNAIGVDSLGNAYVAGISDSAVPMVNPIQATSMGFGDVLIAKLKSDGSALVYSTFLGSSVNQEEADALAVLPNGRVVVSGWTFSTGFPTTPDATQTTLSGVGDAIIVKLQPAPSAIDSGPAGPVSNASPSFGFSSTDSGDSFKCSLDGPDPPTTACVSPKPYAGLSQGAHTFRVEAFDSGGSTSGEVASQQFFVDTVAPGAPALQQPGDGESLLTLSPAFEWSAASDANPSTGIDHYQVLIDGAVNGTVAAGTCSGGTCSATPATPVAEGTHSWKVVAFDAAGNSTGSASRSFTAASPVTASLVVSPNPALVGREVTFDGSGSDAKGGTFAKFEWDLDGDGSFETDTGATPKTTRTYAAPVNLRVQLRVTSVTGQTATADSALVVTDTVSPTDFGVSINNGAQYTRTPDVVVTTTFPASVRSLVFSNDGGFFSPTTFTAQRETKWKLDSSGPERLPKIVYVRFLNGPIVAQTLTDDIILDETPPVVQAATVEPLGGAAAIAKLRAFTVKVKAKDSNSGVDKLQITPNTRKPGKLRAYKRKLTVRAATAKLYVRARDRAGNFSKWRKAR